MSDTVPARPHPALLATAVALPVAVLVGILVAALLISRQPVDEPIPLVTVPAPDAAGPDCVNLLRALPGELGDFHEASLAEPAPAGAKAWRRDKGGDPVVLRCGLERPAGFTKASALQHIRGPASTGQPGVDWFEVAGKDFGQSASTWYAVDRTVYVALTIPDGSGPTPLQDITGAVATVLKKVEPRPGPVPN